MFEDISIVSVGVVVSESEGVVSISICPPWVGRSSWSSSVPIVGGLLRMSFGCRTRGHFLFPACYTSHPHRYNHISHLLLFYSPFFIMGSSRGDLMCLVDSTIDRFVAAAHLRPNFSPYTGTTNCAGEVEITCAVLAAASRLVTGEVQRPAGPPDVEGYLALGLARAPIARMY
jgi:hypothetical protein